MPAWYWLLPPLGLLIAAPFGLPPFAMTLLTDRFVYKFYRKQKSPGIVFVMASIGVMFMLNGIVRFVLMLVFMQSLYAALHAPGHGFPEVLALSSLVACGDDGEGASSTDGTVGIRAGDEQLTPPGLTTPDAADVARWMANCG